MSGEQLLVGAARQRSSEQGGGWVVPILIKEQDSVECENCRARYQVAVEVGLSPGQVEELVRNLNRSLHSIFS